MASRKKEPSTGMVRILYFIFPILLFLLSSCSGQDENVLPNGQSSPENQSEPTITLNIASLATREASSETSVEEKIKSLRIIMISDGFIEYNGFVDLSEQANETTAEFFSYLFKRVTVPGNKSFYFLANEESVEQIFFENIPNLPFGITQGMPLHDFLDSFGKDKLPSDGTLGQNGAGSAQELESLINSAYFSSSFEVKNNTIYLPYSAYYTDIQSDDDQAKNIKKDIWLVPAATKFTFHLNNYRKESVELLEMNLSEINSSSFLMANLDENELTKTYNRKSYYWIDWLELVAEGSQTASDLESFNNKAGWIENYSIPNEDHNSLSLLNLTPLPDEDWSAEKLIDKSNPDVITVVRYYPESKHLVKKLVYNKDTFQYEEVDVQSYSVNFKIIEEREGVIQPTPFESEYFELDTVIALFRATHVVVDVDVFENMVEIFCRIEPWTFVPFQGFVKEEDL